MNNLKYRTCSHFDDIIKIDDFDFDNSLLDKKWYKNILIYDISCNSLIGARLFCIRFNKADGFITVYDGSRYLVLFSPEKCDVIFDRIRYVIG